MFLRVGIVCGMESMQRTVERIAASVTIKALNDHH